MQIEVSKLEFQPQGTKLWQLYGQGGLVCQGAMDVCDVCVEVSVALLVGLFNPKWYLYPHI